MNKEEKKQDSTFTIVNDNGEEIKCEIFGGNISACEVHGENAMLTKRILLQNGFSLLKSPTSGDIQSCRSPLSQTNTCGL